MLHKELTFYETEDCFYFVPRENANNKILVINRQSCAVELKDNEKVNLCNLCAYSIKQIWGIFGVIQLIAGKYLILITQIVQIGKILDKAIYHIENVEIIPYQQSELHLTDDQKRYNRQYQQMLTNFLQAPFFYLSYTYDLSHTLQTLYQPTNKAAFEQTSLFHRADRRFVWNQHLLTDFVRHELAEFCIPIIYGFISITKLKLNSKEFSLIIISRRSVNRAGTRMFSRGADENGFVSNFVETEQIVLFKHKQASFVQIRGSIPLCWSQLPDLRYKPPPTLSLSESSQYDVFCLHLNRLLSQYDAVVLINLINHTGQEEVLKTKLQQVFHNAASNITNMHLESFDFHSECAHNRWDRLSILIESISRYIDLFGYFASSSEEYRYQRGVFRTNCIDSLDRTNVVQTLIAKTSLERQLQHFDVIAVGQRLEDFPTFYSIYRNVWADNADACSIQYAGTPALKADFTRTGKRRFVGKLKDGVNSMVRYFKNNFEDGFRQDAIDLVLGNYQVKLSEGHTVKCPLASRNVLKILTFPLFLLFSMSMFFFSMLLPTEHITEKFFYLLFWFSMSSGVIALMFHYGQEFVDFPTLVPIRKNR